LHVEFEIVKGIVGVTVRKPSASLKATPTMKR